MHTIASRGPPPYRPQICDPIHDIWLYKLDLEQMFFTTIDAECTGTMIKYDILYKEMMRESPDGIVFLINGVLDAERGLREELYSLSRYVTDLHETEGSVLLFMVDHAEEEVSNNCPTL